MKLSKIKLLTMCSAFVIGSISASDTESPKTPTNSPELKAVKPSGPTPGWGNSLLSRLNPFNWWTTVEIKPGVTKEEVAAAIDAHSVAHFGTADLSDEQKEELEAFVQANAMAIFEEFQIAYGLIKRDDLEKRKKEILDKQNVKQDK